VAGELAPVATVVLEPLRGPEPDAELARSELEQAATRGTRMEARVARRMTRDMVSS
jgi:hypothetical protein